MFRNLIIFLVFYFNLSNATVYESYYDVPVTEKRMEELIEAGAVDMCTIDIESCDENEGRRIDGSCNNLKHPSNGAGRTPQLRIIKAVYGDNFEPRKSKNGEPLTIPRKVRQAILKLGKSISQFFTMLLAYYAEFIINDILITRDVTNYIFNITYCCEEQGKTDYMCIPNIIPEDDPVHRFSEYRCMNQTRPVSFQNRGCVDFNTTPDRIDFSTVTWDLNNVYQFDVAVISKIRAYEHGLLKTEIVNGREFPSDGNSSCTILDAMETGCTRTVPNGFIGTNIFTLLFWRLHNLFARKLAVLNPSWDDNKLFDTSRDIVIAIHVHIMYYEFWPLLIGRDNMVKNGIIKKNKDGYRDIYDKNVPLKLFLEYTMVNRWFHTIQRDTQHKITPNGTYVGSLKIVDNSLRVYDLAIDNNIVNILHGATIQPGGDHDYSTDYDIGNRGLGPLQATIDLNTQDIHKDEHFGMAPYIQYRDKCMGYTKEHKTFDDLGYIIKKPNLELLKTVYKYPEDIQLLAGIMMENHIKGGHIPDTAAYVIMKQLKRSVVTDRHWYERPNRPNAFTPAQLREIKKSTMAFILCAVGDEFTHVQPNAFQRISPENQVVSCDQIPEIDISVWKDDTC